MKQKTLIPLIVFLLGICLVGIILYKIDSHETAQNHTTALLNATTYGERIKNEITEGIDVTDVLKQILISESGEFNQFDMIAENLMSDSIESVQLAPNGVVTDIYPSAGNEAGKIDLLHDKDRGKISCYARDNHTIITQGPFKLKQGGSGIAVRNPIFLKDENGLEYFWGFTIVVLRVPDIFSDAVSALSSFGYEYRISKTDAPWSDTYNIVSQSNDSLINPVSYTFTIGEEEWMFEVAPQGGWRNNLLIAKTSVILTANVILLSVLTCALNALSDIPNPTLEIFMKYDRGILYINIQNNCNHEQPSIHAILSAFEPENEHGYGLKNVQRIVEKYHGNLSTECVNDVFNASILLFLSNIEKSE